MGISTSLMAATASMQPCDAFGWSNVKLNVKVFPAGDPPCTPSTVTLSIPSRGTYGVLASQVAGASGSPAGCSSPWAAGVVSSEPGEVEASSLGVEVAGSLPSSLGSPCEVEADVEGDGSSPPPEPALLSAPQPESEAARRSAAAPLAALVRDRRVRVMAIP